MSEKKYSELGFIPAHWMVKTVNELVIEEALFAPKDGNHGGKHPKGTDFINSGIPFIMASDIKGGKIDFSGCNFISYELSKNLDKGFSIEGDVLLSHKATLGRTGIVPKIPSPYIMLTPQVTYYRIRDKDKIDNKYLKYYFDSPVFQDTFANFGDSGSTRAYIGITAQLGLPILLPPLTEQKAIAGVLSSLDDKIDLLHRQNKTLEAMAETLFRQWFIEEAEDDWEEGRLSDVLTIVGGGTPNTSNPDYWDGDLCWLSGGDIARNHKTIITSSEKSITKLGLEKSSAKLLPRYATVITARGTVGKYCILSKSMCFSQSNYGILPKIDECYFFTYCLLSYSVEALQASSYGSVFDTITINTFQQQKIKLPKDEVIISFEKIVTPLFLKMVENQNHTDLLSKTRDLLLPKLIAGEVGLNYDRR